MGALLEQHEDTCHYMMVQIGNYIEVVPDNGVHDIKCMCSTRGFANAKPLNRKCGRQQKNGGADRFISMIAKHFPGAIDVVHIKSPRCDIWCKAK